MWSDPRAEAAVEVQRLIDRCQAALCRAEDSSYAMPSEEALDLLTRTREITAILGEAYAHFTPRRTVEPPAPGEARCWLGARLLALRRLQRAIHFGPDFPG